MNKVSYKLISVIATFALVFSMIGGSVTFANETFVDAEDNPEVIQELNLYSDLDYFDGTVPLENSNVLLVVDGEVVPHVAPLIPLLAAVVIRAGVPFIARLASGQVVRMSAHGASRAVERKITAKAIDNALSKGEKYVDILSGERIALGQDGVAVLLNPKSDTIDTVYYQDGKKLKWFKSNWKFIGDIK